jgi:protein Mpv17
LEAILGPIAANWFRFLQNKVRLPSKRVTLLVRVAADQLLCAPIVTGIFLTSMSVMEGTNPKEKLERVYWKALRANWSIWPAFQAVNLSMVPAQYQVLAVNVFNIGMLNLSLFFPYYIYYQVHVLIWLLAWNCFLSLLNSTF